MLQPKVYIKELNIVREVEMVDFYNKQVSVHDVGIGFRGGAAIFSFDKVEFLENTGLKDKYGDYVYVGSILTDEGVLGDDYWDYATIEKDIDEAKTKTKVSKKKAEENVGKEVEAKKPTKKKSE